MKYAPGAIRIIAFATEHHHRLLLAQRAMLMAKAFAIDTFTDTHSPSGWRGQMGGGADKIVILH
jgi:hypothetical protein